MCYLEVTEDNTPPPTGSAGHHIVLPQLGAESPGVHILGDLEKIKPPPLEEGHFWVDITRLSSEQSCVLSVICKLSADFS